MGHMTSAVRTGDLPYSEAYAVDGVGNRTAQTVGGTGTSFAYDADDELSKTSGGMNRTYSYNANGDTDGWTDGGSTVTYSYDYDDILIQCTLNGSSSTYVNDAIGRRSTRTDSAGNVTTSYYDGGQPLTDWQNGAATSVYLYGNGLLRDNQETAFCDGGGSVRRVTNASQGNPYNVNYDSFGNVEATYGITADPLGFGAQSGYRNEGDLHLLLSGAREWDTTTGRFLTRDTDLSQSPYAYCDGDPVNNTDPSASVCQNRCPEESCCIRPGVNRVEPDDSSDAPGEVPS